MVLMHNAESILVIITSVVLILFLLLAITTAIYVLKLVRSIKKITAKAEDLIDSAESVADAFKNVKGPLAFIKLVNNIVSIVNQHKK